jgi:hypothetical protein
MKLRHALAVLLLGAGCAAAQEPAPAAPAPAPSAPAESYTVKVGSKIPLSLINSISTKHSMAGDRVYLESAFPVMADGRIVIPVGSYVAGTVTQVKKPGRVKGRGELSIRFDSLILPNGVTRDFHATLGGMDAAAQGQVEPAEGKVRSDGNKAGDARTVAETTTVGASLGAITGSAASRPGLGVGVGAGAGAIAGLVAVLVTRGPDAVLSKGATVEMVLDRDLTFSAADLNFSGTQPGLPVPVQPAAGERKTNSPGFPIPRIPR